MKTKKPELTKEMMDRLNELYKKLRQRFYTKEELMVEYKTGERQIRMMITEISHRAPIISTSGTNDGYKVAISASELELVENTWAELSSRIEELEKRCRPLIEFREKILKINNGGNV